MSAIKGKVIVITGASSGIGEATARHLALQGAHVVLGARRVDRLQSLVEEIRGAGGSAHFRTVDVRDREEVKSLIGLAVEQHGRVDVLVNNAGVMPLSTLDRLLVGEWEQMVDINIKGVLNGIAAALPLMKAQRSGHVVNVSSVGASKMVATGAVYCATKSAVTAISEGLRLEVGKEIRVTVVNPGVTTSELADSITDPDSQQMMAHFRDHSIPAEAIARTISYALEQPEGVEVSDLTVRPTGGF